MQGYIEEYYSIVSKFHFANNNLIVLPTSSDKFFLDLKVQVRRKQQTK